MDERQDDTGTAEAQAQADGYVESEPAEASQDEASSDAGSGETGGDERPWSGWGSFAEIQDAVSGLVDSALKTVGPTTGRFPKYDLIEVPDEGWRVLFDLPGLEKSDVEVSAADEELTVAGTRGRPSVPEGAETRRSECTYGRFQRTVAVPPGVDHSGISAKMSNGVLEVRLPRRAAGDARRIDVD